MLGRKQEFNLQFQQVLDGASLVCAFWLAHTLRYRGTEWFNLERPIQPFSEFRWLLFVIIPFGPIILEMQGFYTHPLLKTVLKSLSQMLRGAFWFCLLVAGCVLFLRVDLPSRAVMLLFAPLAAVGLLIRERVTIRFLKRRAVNGRLRENVLLAGLPEDMEELRKTFTPDQLLEMDVAGEIDIETQPVATLVEALHRHAVSRVIFAGGHGHMNRLQEAIAACEIEGVEAWLIADFVKTSIARPDFDVLGSHPMIVFRTTPAVSWALFVKSVVDRVGAIIVLLLSSPFFIVAAIGIKLTSPGPVIFRQSRAGRHGKPFVMYKLRSMQSDAEMRRMALAERNEMSGPVFKIGNDPRITSFGRWLRMTSIDELPQLINVLQGHMSLVGPRPLPVYEVEKFENTAQRRRLSVKPGMTCLWQVSGRNKVRDFQEWVRLDLKYIDNWSIWLDFQILLKTIPVVIFGLGAR